MGACVTPTSFHCTRKKTRAGDGVVVTSLDAVLAGDDDVGDDRSAAAAVDAALDDADDKADDAEEPS